MSHYTKPLKKVVKGLEKASKLHKSQAKILKKILKDQMKTYSNDVRKAKYND
tara:strand:- start:121 stop:276 length:156 start_codon:yes stop_codon:yes gene_type:complete